MTFLKRTMIYLILSTFQLTALSQDLPRDIWEHPKTKIQAMKDFIDTSECRKFIVSNVTHTHVFETKSVYERNDDNWAFVYNCGDYKIGSIVVESVILYKGQTCLVFNETCYAVRAKVFYIEGLMGYPYNFDTIIRLPLES